MDVEHILKTLNSHSVEYILIGGAFAGNSNPLTCDAAILIHDTPANRTELNFALQELGCECKLTDDKAQPVPHDPQWIEGDSDFQLTSPHGSLHIYRSVRGVEDSFDAYRAQASIHSMQDGEMYYSIDAKDTDDTEKAAHDDTERAKDHEEDIA